MIPQKRAGAANKENNVPKEVRFTSNLNAEPPPKRRKALNGDALRVEVERQQAERRRQNEAQAAAAQREAGEKVEREEFERKERLDDLRRSIFGLVRNSDFTLGDAMCAVVKTKDQHESSWISKTLVSHGGELLDAMHERKPEVVDAWIDDKMRRKYASEGRKLADRLRQNQGRGISVCLEEFSLAGIMEDVKDCAPKLWDTLRSMGGDNGDLNVSQRRDRDLVSSSAVPFYATDYMNRCTR